MIGDIYEVYVCKLDEEILYVGQGKSGGKYLNKEAAKKALKNNLHNLFNQRWKCSADDRMWTSFDDTRTFIANGKYGKQFLAFNYRVND